MGWVLCFSTAMWMQKWGQGEAEGLTPMAYLGREGAGIQSRQFASEPMVLTSMQRFLSNQTAVSSDTYARFLKVAMALRTQMQNASVSSLES